MSTSSSSNLSGRPLRNIGQVIDARPGVANWVRLIFCMAAALLVCAPALSYAQQSPTTAQTEERFDRASRLMREATRFRPDGMHLRLLRGLRQLHDPNLKPFFVTLFTEDNPSIKVHALLGAAAISDPPRIDTWKLSQLQEKAELQRAAFGEALSSQFVGVEELKAILDFPNLDDAMKSVVMLNLIGMGEPPSTESMRALMQSTNSPIVRARAALGLLHLGETEGCDEALASVDDLPRSIRREAITNLVGLVHAHRLQNCNDWLQLLLQAEDMSISLRLGVVRDLIQLDAEAGRAAWHSLYLSSDGLAHKIRSILMLLTVADQVLPTDFDVAMHDNYPLLVAIAGTGKAIASKSTAVDECLHLISFRHPISSAWVLDHARTISETESDDAIQITSALIRDAMQDGPSLEERLELALLSSSLLTRLDADRASGLLQEADQGRKRLVEEAILAGAWQSRSPNALILVNQTDHWLSTRAGSIAAIIKARQTEVGQLTPDDEYRLSLAFGGAGHVSAEYQVQAAWLYLRHTGQEGPALATILADVSKSHPKRNQ